MEGEDVVVRQEPPYLEKGTRIRFIRELSSGPSEESPGNLYALEGDLGWVDRSGGCWEGYWVFWDRWPTASFGARLGSDFEVVDPAEDEERVLMRYGGYKGRPLGLFLQQLYQRLGREQVVHVLRSMDLVCNHCWESLSGCQCWNDE